MIYSLVILICTSTGDKCVTETIPSTMQSQRQCEVAKSFAELRLEEEGLRGMARCVNWGQPA